MVKKNVDKIKEIENLKYEVAQEMGLPQSKKRQKKG
ncbi:MAG: small, acid-soluble spore protein, alpha/beta type [Peptococcaceae bacterium]|nr:small, acid-soluble spore protein, alpha/beta type [Peptococcaceae bacterium]